MPCGCRNRKHLSGFIRHSHFFFFCHTAGTLQSSSSEIWLDWLMWLPAHIHHTKIAKATFLIKLQEFSLLCPMAQTRYKKSYFYSRVTTLHSADMSLLEKKKRFFNAASALQSAQESCTIVGFLPRAPPSGHLCTINAKLNQLNRCLQRFLSRLLLHLLSRGDGAAAPDHHVNHLHPKSLQPSDPDHLWCHSHVLSGTSSFIRWVWKWWNGTREWLHHQRVITSDQSGGSLHTSKGIEQVCMDDHTQRLHLRHRRVTPPQWDEKNDWIRKCKLHLFSLSQKKVEGRQESSLRHPL